MRWITTVTRRPDAFLVVHSTAPSRQLRCTKQSAALLQVQRPGWPRRGERSPSGGGATTAASGARGPQQPQRPPQHRGRAVTPVSGPQQRPAAVWAQVSGCLCVHRCLLQGHRCCSCHTAWRMSMFRCEGAVWCCSSICRRFADNSLQEFWHWHTARRRRRRSIPAPW